MAWIQIEQKFKIAAIMMGSDKWLGFRQIELVCVRIRVGTSLGRVFLSEFERKITKMAES